MPKIDIDGIMRLSKLSDSECDREALVADMASMVAFAENISGGNPRELDGRRVGCPLREDGPVEPFGRYSRDELLSSAPSTDNGFITVPRTVDN